MKLSATQKLFKNQVFLVATASLCVVLLSQGNYVIAQTPQAQSAVQQTTTTESDAPVIPADQLDSLVAPIALFPDPLLAQTLAASTYPLEVIQLQQWMEKNPDLKDKALADAVAKQPWDPSVQALAIVPDVVQRLAGNIQWTTDLGNAFLAQQSDVMDAVQRMRGKAETKGALKTSSQQVVETKVVEGGKQVIEIQPAQADVVYVPSYDPVVVYGAPAYPYYPYTYPGYYPGMGLAWGAAGFALGAWAGGNWGNCNWNNGDINVNRNNNFNRNTNINGGNRNNVNRPGQLPSRGGGGNWQHNPTHRGNAPYGDRGTANKYGGSARGDQGARGGAGAANRPGTGAGNRPGSGAGAANRPGGGAGASNRPGSGNGNRPGGGASTKPANRTGGGSNARPSGGNTARQSSKGATTRPSNSSSRSSSQVGNRSVSSSPNRSSSNAFSSGGRSGSSSRAASSRGGSSMGGGGMSRGGGGGGGRGGGGGGRR